MSFRIVDAVDLPVSIWSGGTTTQLFISPQGSSYAARDFDFRLSVATVEAESSVFTALPGVSRKLMILDGEVRVEHKGRYQKTLGVFDQDSFEGDWETVSAGTCTDFNLMMRNGVQGDVEAVVLEEGALHNLVNDSEPSKTFAYLWRGAVTVGGVSVKMGSLLVIEGAGAAVISCDECAQLVVCRVAIPGKTG